MQLIFVYGTLKRGFPNHDLLAGSEFVGQVETESIYRMWDCGSYPCLTEEPSLYSCKGELWRVDDRTLRALDRLEGVPHLYSRAEVFIKGCKETVLGYLYNQDVGTMPECGPEWV